MHVDVILLSRDLSPPAPDVWEGIRSQAGVNLVIHRQVGTPRPGDRNRWETIARARNEARAVGSCPWVMLLDDDVVLGPACLDTPGSRALEQRPEFAALGADSAGEMNRPGESWDRPSHVGMAAVMFRREALAGLTFRWEGDKCECLCCCEDLRAAGWGIGYQPGALAWHRPATPDPTVSPTGTRADVSAIATRSAASGAGTAGQNPRGLRSTRPQPVSHPVPDDAPRGGQPRTCLGVRVRTVPDRAANGWPSSPA